jgi:DNA polymerase-3 subunit delta'
MSAPYPWLEGVWQRLLAGRPRPPQALLIAGPEGIGKRALARAWAQALLCESPLPSGEACGACAGCHWFGAGTHPDFRLVSLIEKENDKGEMRLATEITVDQAREAVDFVQMSTHRAGRRVVLVDAADAFNLAAANALLKVLEEPPLNTSFVLVSEQPRRLLPTIRSRCTRVELGLPTPEAALAWLGEQGVAAAADWLALAGGAPLRAQRWAEAGGLAERNAILAALADPLRLDPVARAEAWKGVDPRAWHGLAYTWLCDLLAAHLAVRPRFNPDCAAALAGIAPQADLSRLLALARLHAERGRSVLHPLNRQLQLEEWLIRYRNVFERGTRA